MIASELLISPAAPKPRSGAAVPLKIWFQNLSLRAKILLVLWTLAVPPLMGAIGYLTYNFYWMQVQTALGGLMNFADAKQQGVIRFLGQNEKLAKQLATLLDAAPPEAVAAYFSKIVASDVFRVEDHPFASEIMAGTRKIPAWNVYYDIDYVEGGVIKISSDAARVGRAWSKPIDAKHGYSDVWEDQGKYLLTFSASTRKGIVYVHANALMLNDIVNGEIGNLEGGIGAFYLAGVGKTFDYYIVDQNNQMITESRVRPKAMLRLSGSEQPWLTTMQQAGVICGKTGTYATNGRCTTGCREVMGFYTGPLGVSMLGASMPFYDSGWTIVVEQQASELLQPLL